MFSAGVGVGIFKTAGVGVGSRSRFFKTAGVGVGFSKLLESESGVGILKNLPTPQPWLNCSWTVTTLLLLQTPFSTEIEVCRYLVALVDCRLPSTWACSTATCRRLRRTKRQYERRINSKINVRCRPCEFSLKFC